MQIQETKSFPEEEKFFRDKIYRSPSQLTDHHLLLSLAETAALLKKSFCTNAGLCEIKRLKGM